MMIKILKYHLPAWTQDLKTVLLFANSIKHVKNILPFATIFFLSLVSTNDIHAQVLPADYLPGTLTNYVRTWDATAPEQNPNTLMTRPLKDVKQATQYFDGLGRPLQTVIKQGSLKTGVAPTDLVSANVYDEFGREAYKFLPYAETTSTAEDGAFKLTPFTKQAAFYNSSNTSSPIYNQGETFFYSKTNFEASPLNRPEKTMAPGNNWVGNNRGVEVKYWINTAIDEVRIWNVTNVANTFGTYATTGFYAAGELYKNVTIDEHGKQVIEFKDKEGKVILKKVQLTAAEDNGTGANHTGWLCTYYLYDDLNNLRCVVPPLCTEAIGINWLLTDAFTIAELCFRYEYDQRNRVIKKKVPGAGEVWMVYDARDRLVMTQDANMRFLQKWMYTQYDFLNRPFSTGLITDPANYNNHSFHLDAAYNNSTGYPVLGSYVYEELTRTGYDDYSSIPASSGLTYGITPPATAGFFSVSYNTSPEYAQSLTATAQTKGLVTWTQTKILGTTNSFLYAVNIYDEKGRIIQVKSSNITGATDITTTQYSWNGLPLRSEYKQQITGTTPQTTVVLTQTTYDNLWRAVNTEKKTGSSLVNSGAMPADFTKVSALEYDKLGQMLKKKMGKKIPSPTISLANLDYEYNIRGWLLSVNKNYIAGPANADQYFGMELGYDKNSASASFIPQYTGNISGTVWRSEGDREKRKYDFGYDAGNRLLKADFTQQNGTAWDISAGVDFSMRLGNGTDPLTAYDANGNIKAMWQKGLTLNGSVVIDDLLYYYLGFPGTSNKLRRIRDLSFTDFKLSDFTYNFIGGVNYGFDPNGNTITDRNKYIWGVTGIDKTTGGGIIYNHLNLPKKINVINTDPIYIDVTTLKGTIEYIYDAAGIKIKKITTENPAIANGNKTITNTTSYLGGMVYESKTTVPANIPNDDYTDRLQFIGHEEGRIRFKPATVVPASFVYDYFIKDHLGNVRVVLTEEQQTDPYPAATMEVAQTTTEELLYANLNTTRIDKPVSYPVDNTTNPNAKVAKVSAAAGSQKVGPSITLKVMAGDKFNLKVSSWYKTNGTSPAPPQSPLPDLLLALVNGISGASGGKVASTELQTSGVLTPGATQFLGTQTPDATRPKAYLNWILFDEQFKMVSSNSSFEQVPAETAFGTIPNQIVYPHIKTNLTIDKCGYLYVYVSNETPNIDVFFDNLQVTHTRGAILETSQYYPFGLQMKNISYRSLKSAYAENKKGFNGNELQSKEFSDGSGLEVYDFNARTYDQQIARFIQIDPASEEGGQESLTPYQFGLNNPIRYDDPDGKCPPCIVYRLLRTLELIGRLLPTGVRVSNLAIPIRDATSVIIKTVPNNFPITKNNSTAKENELNALEERKGELQDSKESFQKNIKEHKEKLEEFKKDPIGNSGEKWLENAKKDNPSKETLLERAKGREIALEKQIKKNEGELKKTNKELEKVNEGINKLKKN